MDQYITLHFYFSNNAFSWCVALCKYLFYYTYNKNIYPANLSNSKIMISLENSFHKTQLFFYKIPIYWVNAAFTQRILSTWIKWHLNFPLEYNYVKVIAKLNAAPSYHALQKSQITITHSITSQVSQWCLNVMHFELMTNFVSCYYRYKWPSPLTFQPVKKVRFFKEGPHISWY
jgi:hypothetical protein